MAISIDTRPIPLSVDPDDVIRVAGTRVTLDTVVTAFLEGETAEEIAQQYPALDLGDVYAVLGYYLRDREQVERYLRDRQEAAARVRRDSEGHFDPKGVRARLLARRRHG